MTEAGILRIAMLAMPEALPYAMMGPLDILRATSLMSTGESGAAAPQRFVVDLVAESTAAFTTYNGVVVKPDVAIDASSRYDVVWIPSLVVSPTGLFDKHVRLQQWLKKQYADGAEVLSVCTGAFLLAETGLLNGLKATTHWAYADAFRAEFPSVDLQPQLTLVDNGRIKCAGAGAAWHDMAMNLIERKSGKRAAVQVGKMFLLQYHHNGQKHLAFADAPLCSNDVQIEKAQRWMLAHLSEDSLIQRAAREIQLTESTFNRRFKQATQTSPNVWVQQIRIAKAKEALELTQQSVDDISALVGYQDSSFFRRLFKRETGMSPAQYRRAFAG